MFEVIEWMAVVSSATFGILLARRKELDFIGVYAVACIMAFGGGTLRDVLLDRTPLFWIQKSHYPLMVFILAMLGSVPIPFQARRLERFLHVPDALGLGLFSIVGTVYALEAGTSWFVASLFGVITGTFGGVAGDVIINEIPKLFRTSPLCATCSFAGSWLYLLGSLTTLTQPALLAIAVSFIVVFRLAAIRWNWTLPVTKLET